MARYLVTGGAGFIGSHLAEALLARGHSVRVLDDLSNGKRENVPRNAEFIASSVVDPCAVREALEGVDGCFHLAAIASVERAQREWHRSHLVNLSGAVAVFEAAHRLQERHGKALPVVYASSAAVYGNLDKIPLGEASPTRPISPYGVDKLGCELHAAVAGPLFGVSTTGLRLFNVYGPRQDPSSPYSGVVSIFCQRLLQGSEIEIHGDGRQVRDFVYVQDAVTAFCSAMESASAQPRVFNVATGSGTTVCQLAETIAAVCGVPVKARHVSPRSGDLRASVGDPRRAAEGMSFSAGIPLEHGLRETLRFLTESRPPAR
jgi:UDP-glucose 4-epimerase